MQFSLFGAAAAAPSLQDLDGVLLAGGHWARGNGGAQGSGTARLSVVVADRWRADALAEAFAVLGVGDPDPVTQTPVGLSVRTGFTAALAPAAQRWTRGAREAAPADLVLTAGGLRLWAIAAGHRDEVGYLLGTAAADDPLHLIAGAQLARLGVTAGSVSMRGGPGWRVTSVRRMRRLAELLGPAPAGGEQQWPSLTAGPQHATSG